MLFLYPKTVRYETKNQYRLLLAERVAPIGFLRFKPLVASSTQGRKADGEGREAEQKGL